MTGLIINVRTMNETLHRRLPKQLNVAVNRKMMRCLSATASIEHGESEATSLADR